MNKKTQSSFLFFSFYDQKSTDGLSKRGSKAAELHPQEPRYKYCFITSRSPKQILKVSPPLAKRPHNARGDASFIYAENTWVLFTLGTTCISCYFRSIKVQLPHLHRQMSKKSSSQYPMTVLVWFGFMAYQTLLVIQCQILFYIYIKYMKSKHIL